MNYDEMEAGREMDALVAEKVMGWKRVPSEDDPAGWCWLAPHGSTRASTTELMPRFSGDISAAWGVVEKMNGLMDLFYRPNDEMYYCHFEFDTHKGHSRGPVAPLAICRAALKAVAA